MPLQVEAVSTMHVASKVAQSNLKTMNIDRVDQVMDEINETNEQMQAINQALGQPTGLGAGIDEDELLNEVRAKGVNGVSFFPSFLLRQDS